MKRLLAIAAILLPIYLFSQGFGSFSRDQPFLSGNIATGPTDISCNGEVFPTLTSANIVARWDPNISGTNDGDLVVTLQDTWTNYYNLIATNGTSNRPYWTNDASGINNRGFLHFDCTGNIMRTNMTTSYNYPNVYFLVVKQISSCNGGNNQFFCSSDSYFPACTFFQVGIPESRYEFYDGAVLPWNVSEGGVVYTAWQVFILRQNGASSSARTGGWSGVSGNIGTGNGKGMVLGAAFDNSAPTGMDIGYFLWVNGNLSGTEETNVVRWIANCFNVPSNYGP